MPLLYSHSQGQAWDGYWGMEKVDQGWEGDDTGGISHPLSLPLSALWDVPGLVSAI